MIIGLDTAGDRWHATVQGVGNRKAHFPTAKGPTKGWSTDQRREELCRSFDEFLSEMVVLAGAEEIHLFCEESQAFGKNGKTTRILNMVTGALWCVGLKYPIFWHWVGSSQWKAMCGTSGKKKAVAYPLEKAWCIERGANDHWDQDHYVSFACAEYGEQALLEAMLR